MALAAMAEVVGDQATVTVATRKAAQLAEQLRQAWWLADEGLFADIRATVSEVEATLQQIDRLQTEPQWPAIAQQAAQAHRLFDAQLHAQRESASEVELPWLLRHWVVLCPLEVGVATPAQATRSFTRLLSPEFCNEWGMYLHPERQDVMSINSGLLALALVRYGRIAEALKLVQAQVATLTMRMPGAISEALPDQWCFLQLWSAVGIISPIVEGVLGIEPQAGTRQLQVIPHLPSDWPAVTLERIRVGESTFTVSVRQSPTTYQLTVTASQGPAYRLRVGFYLPATAVVAAVYLNEQAVPWHWESTNAGRRLVCEATGAANLVVTVAAP